MSIIQFYKNTNNEVTFERVKKVLRGEIPDRVPYIDYWYVNQQVVEHVLERKLPSLGWFDDAISAPDDFEFAVVSAERGEFVSESPGDAGVGRDERVYVHCDAHFAVRAPLDAAGLDVAWRQQQSCVFFGSPQHKV